MALTLNVDGVTGIDESIGNQKLAGVKHDIDGDAFPAAVAAVFDTALSGYGLTTGDAIEHAGDPSDGTDGNDVQVSGGMITGLSLTDEDGNLFDGTYDSGLKTLADNTINLLSAADDNVVLGIEAGTGDVVFAIYLEEVTDSGEIVGGDFWVALFEPLKHPDPDNPDDVVDLTNKLFVSAEQIIDFSFKGAPSGQNEFMAFESNGVTIVASGEANGDTVNSGQGANLGDKTDKTALGTNSQAINAGQELNFNFTTGFNPDYIVPDLTPTEASNQAHIQFTGVHNTTGAAFNMVKVTGGGATTMPLVHLSAWHTDVEIGTDFITGHGDDTAVAISKVFINGVDVTGDASKVLDNGNGTFTVIGAVENDRINVETNGGLTFNRLAIRNDGDDNVAFSVQAFSLVSTAVDTKEAGSKIDFYDDGPSELAQKVDLIVYEDALAGGNPDNDGATEVTAVTGNLADLFEPGRDTPGLHFGAIASKDGSSLNSVNGLTFDVAVTKGADITVDGVLYVDEIMLSMAGTDHVQILVKEDGAILFTLLAAIDHSVQLVGNPDDDVDQLSLGDLFEAFDEDGDRQTFAATAVEGIIEDDAPVFDIAPGAGTLKTDDGALAGGNAGGSASDMSDSLFTIVTSSPGADDDGGTVWELELSGLTVATTLVDTETGDAVQLSKNVATGNIEGKTVGGLLVFSLAVDSDTGEVTMTQARAVMHGNAETEPAYNDDTVGLGLAAEDYINLKGTLSDGETTPDTASDAVDIAPAISFTDDGPEIDLTDLGGKLRTDDGDLEGGNAGDGMGNDTDTIGAGTLFSVTSSAGADGDGGTVYTLELGANAASLTLRDAGTNELVQLVENGVTGAIEGRTVDSDDLVFDLTVDSSTGAVTQTQYRAVVQPTADTSAPYYDDIVGLGAFDAVYLRGTLKDGETEADSATDFIDISDNIEFTDDGPEITVENASGAYTPGAQGDWSDSPGADGFEALGVKLLSYEIDANGTVPVNTALVDGVDGNPYKFGGSITDDFNGDGVDETVPFTLTFDADAGTYDLQVTTPPTTVVTFDTTGGSLDAGGPDPVRTLTVDSTEIVFSAVVPDTDPTLIDDFLNASEADIEANATYLDSAQLNVSTSGIANGNNVLEGNALEGPPDGETTQGGKRDESFVVDPDGLVSSVKVFIDNSVGGYSRPSEELYYRVYNADGTESDWILVDGT